MSTGYNAQIGGGKYKLQFETDNQRLFKFIEMAVQMAVDVDRKNGEICSELILHENSEEAKRVLKGGAE